MTQPPGGQLPAAQPQLPRPQPLSPRDVEIRRAKGGCLTAFIVWAIGSTLLFCVGSGVVVYLIGFTSMSPDLEVLEHVVMMIVAVFSGGCIFIGILYLTRWYMAARDEQKTRSKKLTFEHVLKYGLWVFVAFAAGIILILLAEVFYAAFQAK